MQNKARLRIEVFGRADLPGGVTKQRTVRDRLAELDAAGRVDGVERHTWEGRIRTSDDEPPTETVEWVRRFEDWADAGGVSLEPFFERNERSSPITGDEYEELILPVLCVAAIRDGEIERVAPCKEDGECVTVEDCLEEIAAAAPGAASEDADADPEEASPERSTPHVAAE